MIKDTNFTPKILVLTAPSGTGKTTIANALIAQDSRFILNVSVTSRPRRPGEVEGKDYHFISPLQFEEYINQGRMLEYTTLHDNYYGILKDNIDRCLTTAKIMLFTIDFYGFRSLRVDYPQETLGIFMRPPNRETLVDRLKQRGASAEEIVLRMATYDEYASHAKEYDYIIVNNDIDRTVQSILSIVDHADNP
jgi:guanylate kinase